MLKERIRILLFTLILFLIHNNVNSNPALVGGKVNTIPSVDDINTFWKVLEARTNLESYNKDELHSLMLDLVDLDKRLKVVPSPAFMAASGKKRGWSRTDTATTILQQILKDAGDITKGIRFTEFKPITKDMTLEAIRFTRIKNGRKALMEVLLTGQSPQQVFTQYDIKTTSKTLTMIKQLKKAMKTDNEYSRYINNRGRALKLDEQSGMRAED